MTPTAVDGESTAVRWPPMDQAGFAVNLAAVVTDDFTELFRVHYPRLVRALRLAGAAPTEAEDMAQEAFARTLRRWRQVRNGINPPGYPFRIAFHLLNRRGLLPTSPLDDQLASLATGPDDQASLSTDVERALAVMPPRRRACVVLCWMQGLTTGEVGEALGIASGTVRKQLELARRQLAGELTI